MKRILVSLLAAVLMLSLCAASVGAEGGKTLIPLDSEWTTVPYEGYDITVNVTDSAAVFSAEGYWPCAQTYYDEENIIKASIDEYSLVYDFSVDVGQTNINFYFTDGFGSSGSYSISNTALGSVSYDPGSGDLQAGDYRGVMKLSDLVNSTMHLQSKTFPSDMITEDNELIFNGIEIYSVNSSTVTIRTLEIVKNEDATVPEDTSLGTAESEAESSEPISEPVSELTSAESKEESKTESKVESKVESTTESTADSVDLGDESNAGDEGGLGAWLYVIIAAAVLAVGIAVAVVVKKKK